QLQTHEILFLLDEAEQWVALNRQPKKHTDRLAGLTIINAFFENSTRTLLSFEIAGKRLGADVVNMHAAQSSVKKGETLIDTAMTLNAMRADAIVIRHGSSGAVRLSARPALMAGGVEARGVEPVHDFDGALAGADVVMMLRLQNERMEGQFLPSPREYRHLYGLTLERLARAAPDAIVMHPGPMNR